jgi:RHS repeat-associated protein
LFEPGDSNASYGVSSWPEGTLKTTGGDTIKFHYGPDGNRIAKEVFVDSLHRWTNTYYVHDAQGNIMATYQWLNRDTFSLDELVMYGSSRLGTLGANIVLCDTALRDTAYYALHDTSTNPFTDSVTYFTAGQKQYEFTNHLGNVLLTLTDRHIPIYILGGFALYKPEVASAQDYYPFGMVEPGRHTASANGYRFGFNGKERDDEAKGPGNQLDFGARAYDSRIGRWLSHDRVFKPWLSPYESVKNNPTNMIDPDGQDEFHFIHSSSLNTQTGYGTSSRSFYIIKKAGPDEFYYHVQTAMYNMETRTSSETENITQFYPNNPNSKTGITSTTYGLGFLTKNDNDAISLGKLALTSPGALSAIMKGGIYTNNIKDALSKINIEQIQQKEAVLLNLLLIADGIIGLSRGGVLTDYGTKFQTYTPEALSAAKNVYNGAKLYRIGTSGISTTGEQAQFWSLENPLENPGAYSQKYGIPLDNITNADFIETANLKPGAQFITREAESAPGSAPGSGGGVEAVIQKGGTTNNQITKVN